MELSTGMTAAGRGARLRHVCAGSNRRARVVRSSDSDAAPAASRPDDGHPRLRRGAARGASHRTGPVHRCATGEPSHRCPLPVTWTRGEAVTWLQGERNATNLSGDRVKLRARADLVGGYKYRSSPLDTCHHSPKRTPPLLSLLLLPIERPSTNQHSAARKAAACSCSGSSHGEVPRPSGARRRPGGGPGRGGAGGKRDAVQGRRAQGLERAGPLGRALQHLGGEAALPDRRPAPVRVPQGEGLGAAGGRGGVQRVQHVVVPSQVRRRQHGVHLGPPRPLLLHQRLRGQLPGQREARRRRPRPLHPARHDDAAAPFFFRASCAQTPVAARSLGRRSRGHPDVLAGSPGHAHRAAASGSFSPGARSPGHPDDLATAARSPGHPDDLATAVRSPGHPDDLATVAGSREHPDDLATVAGSREHPDDLAAGARCAGPAAVDDTRRRVAAAVCFRAGRWG